MTSSDVLISVVIPCFNHGRYLQEAIDSIQEDQIPHALEVIIVDDGSTDAQTLSKLQELADQGRQVIFQANAGPAAARNTAIKHARGKYIIPLDSDNRISPDYINRAVAMLEAGQCEIVYCPPVFFGDLHLHSRQFKSMPFDAGELLAGNYIDNCAVFTREVWIKNNGYDTALPHWGHEDWEFWINALSNGFRFHFIADRLFYYRIATSSVSTQFEDAKKFQKNQIYILRKHASLYLREYSKLVYIKRKYKRDISRFIVSPFIFLAYLLRIVRSPFDRADEKFDEGSAAASEIRS